MHSRRIASFLLGAWLLGSLWIPFTAIHNLSAADEVVNTPESGAVKPIAQLGNETSRLLLRHAASEANRSLTSIWEIVELGFALVLGGLLLPERQHRLFLSFCGAMLLIVIFLHVYVSPEITYFGRQVDFPSSSSGASRGQLDHMRQLYIALDVLKIGLGAVIAAMLFKGRPGRRFHSGEDAARAERFVNQG